MFIPYLAYEASAGSGKTFALSIRYISLLFLGANPSNILTLTFTNKAANEMQERIFSILRELHLKKREPELKELSEILEVDSSYILKNRSYVIDTFLNSDIKISTIDKFLSQILRKFSSYLDLLPDFEIDEDKDEIIKLEIFLKELLENGKYEKFLDFVLLLERRFSDVFALLERFYEIDYEIEKISIENRKLISKERVLLFLNEIKRIFFECKALSASAKKSLNIEDINGIVSSSWICKDSLRDFRYFKKCYKEEADRYFYDLKEALRDFAKFKEFTVIKEFLNFYEIYKASNKAASIELNRLTFMDVTNFVYELLHRHIERDFLYFRLDSKIEHILLDEFQDTSIVQYKILEPLIEEICSGEGAKSFRSFFYVGDTKQSIYRFRGGAKELFYHLAKRFHIELKALKTNYRSKKAIVDFVNDTFKDLMPHYIPQNANNKESGYVEVKESEDILESIIESVKFLKNSGVRDEDIAILTYTNTDSLEIENALRNAFEDIKITTEATSLLINQPSVRAVIEYLIYLYFKKEYNKENFQSLIGERFEDEKMFKDFDISSPLPLLIKEIIERFKLFDKDPNLIKLIEISSKYLDIESFIFNYESINEKSVYRENEGIKILTIHKSKGLEFEHLIVCDRLSKKGWGGSSFLFSYEGIDLKNIFYKMQNRKCFDKEYEEAVKKEERLSFEDELNANYVAFTRAKNSLIICKKEKNSSFDIFNLKPFKKGEINVLQKEGKKEKAKDICYFPFSIRRDKADENLENEDLKDDIQDIKAVNFGIAMHYTLEMMQSFDKEGLKDAFCAMKNRYGYLLDREEMEDIKSRIKKALENREFLNLIDGKIRKEQDISYNGKFYRIDLLIEKEEEWIIIDYKSSLFKRGEHIKQVEIYKNILKSILRGRVRAYLLYLQKEDISLIEV